MKTSIGIKPEKMRVVVDILCRVLADEFVLNLKIKNAHWNVEGPNFFSNHKFFEAQYAQLDDYIDQIAERIRTFGHYVPASLQQFLNLTDLTEQSLEGSSGPHFFSLLLSDHESIIMQMRSHLGKLDDELFDMGTSDFLTGIMEYHEKTAWMLRANLKD